MQAHAPGCDGNLPDSHDELLQTQIPYASNVGKMDMYRMPVGWFASRSQAYQSLWLEVQKRFD